MLKKRTCVVVGDAGGKGGSLVEKYAECSYCIAFMDADKAFGNSLKLKLEQEYGRRVFFFHGDADSEEDLELFAGAVIGQYRKVDCLYYHKNISQRVGMIERLLDGHLKNDGVVEAFC